MSTTCEKIACCLATDITLGDLSGFSLVGGDFPGGSIAGNAESTFLVECPEGLVCEEGVYPYTVVLPKNTVQYPYGPDGGDGPIYLRVPCGSTFIVRVVPASTSSEDVLATLAEMITECGQTTADNTRPPNTASVATLYSNAEISPVLCDGLKFSASPGGLLVFDNTAKTARLPAGVLTSYDGQEAADNKATQYVSTRIAAFKAGGGQCGYWNTAQQKCPPDGATAAANTFFSAVSQAQADQDALDSLAECACNATIDALTWSLTGGGVGSGSGANASVSVPAPAFSGGISSSSYNPGTATNCSLRVVGSITGPSGIIQVSCSQIPGNQFYETAAGSYDVTIPVTLPALTQTWAINLSRNADPSATVQCSITIGPP